MNGGKEVLLSQDRILEEEGTVAPAEVLSSPRRDSLLPRSVRGHVLTIPR